MHGVSDAHDCGTEWPPALHHCWLWRAGQHALSLLQKSRDNTSLPLAEGDSSLVDVHGWP